MAEPKVFRYAIVDKGGNVVNVSLWDGIPTWTPSEGLKAVKDTDDKAQIGGRFIPQLAKCLYSLYYILFYLG